MNTAAAANRTSRVAARGLFVPIIRRTAAPHWKQIRSRWPVATCSCSRLSPLRAPPTRLENLTSGPYIPARVRGISIRLSGAARPRPAQPLSSVTRSRVKTSSIAKRRCGSRQRIELVPAVGPDRMRDRTSAVRHQAGRSPPCWCRTLDRRVHGTAPPASVLPQVKKKKKKKSRFSS